MKEKFMNYLPIIGIFIIFSAFVFFPELQGKKLGSHDSVSWYGAAKEMLIYMEKGEDILWTNRVFAGMPLYMIGGNFSGNYILWGYYGLVDMLPDQIVNIFFVFLFSFMGLIALNTPRNSATWLAIAVGINTWVIDSLIASHSSKILAVAFIMATICGLIGYLYYNKRWTLILIGVSLSLAIGINHLQIVYYGLISIIIVLTYILILKFKSKPLKTWLIEGLTLLVIVMLAVGANYSSLWITRDYAKDTMRGGKTELVKAEATSTAKDGGLDINYAFSWSYTPSELLNFIVPDAKGGASSYAVKPSKSKLADALGKEKVPIYWGEQPFTGAPNYVGVVVIFLAIFSLFYTQNKIKYAFLSIIVLFSMMALGRFFMDFNSILFENLPFYNKFRTPTMSFSMANISYVILAGLGLSELYRDSSDHARILKALKFSIYTIFGLMIIGFVSISNSGYTSSQDAQIFGDNQQLLQLAIQDRESFFKSDLVRSIFLVLLTAGLIYSCIKNWLSAKTLFIALGIIGVCELWFVSNRYYDKGAFVKCDKIEDLIPNEPYNQYMEKDTTYFRMFNTTTSVFNDNTDGYRYSNVGGYSPAKLYRYQDLIDVHLSKMNMNVLNMLNTKYFVVDQNGQKAVQTNPDACGNVWYPAQVKFAKNANEEMDSIGTSNPKQTVWVDARYKSETQFTPNTDPNATISLTKYHPDRMEYISNSSSGGYAIFSEIWYRGNEDWKIYIDGKESKLVRTNYLLRGAYIPAGNHKIEMKYSNDTLYWYRNLGRIATIIMIALMIGILYTIYRPKHSNQ